MSAERQSPSAAYAPTQTQESMMIRSVERTSADLRNRSSGVSVGREPTAAACAATLVARSRKLIRKTLDRGGALSTRLARKLAHIDLAITWFATVSKTASGVWGRRGFESLSSASPAHNQRAAAAAVF